jgi:hypothetical protein
MRKLLILCAALAGVASGAEADDGYFLFTAGRRTVWDGFSGPSSVVSSGTVNVGFMWGTTGTPLVITDAGNGNVGSPTNAPVFFTWSDILNDPNYQFAVNSTSSSLVVTPSNTSTLARGGWSYNSANLFQVAGTVAGNTYTVIVIGWDAHYATPQLAAAAGSPAGWSQAISYSATTSSGTPPFFTSAGVTPFGVIPEPGTVALIGMGAASLLLCRRSCAARFRV